METTMTDKQTLSTSPMKQSVSMISLPPPTSNGRDNDASDSSIAAKVLIDRPYNSLKKERNPEKDLWRNSWGSNQSFVGKDDFWLALQSNYNYIMDTNLIDSCREARGELELNYSTETSHTDQKKINGGKPSDDYIVDLKRLRLWLREMEKQLAQFPTISDAIKMKDFELEKLQKKNEELYRIIAKHAKLIGACTRSLSRQRDSSETPTSLITQNNTDNLQSEVEQQHQHQQEPSEYQQQVPHDDDNCFSSLETHITRRSHSSSNSNNECNLKALERRYHSLYLKSFEISVLLENLLKNDDLLNSASHSSSSEIDEGPAAKLARFTNDLIAENHQRISINTNQSKRKFYESTDENPSDDDDDCQFPSYFDNTVKVQTNGFDADSEGSDCELIHMTNNMVEEQSANNTDNNGNPINVSNNSEEVPQSNMNDFNGPKSASLPPTPSKQLAGVKRPRKVDATKFNRSNRESKNCGTFYFKHSDTEPENGSNKNNGNDWSSQDATSELCSEEEWEYSKGSDVNGNTSNGNEDTIDNEQLADISIQVNANESILFDTVDSPFAHKQICENEKFEQSTPVNVIKSSVEKKLYKEIAKAYSKESIQQLVMGAENLVRDELLKTPVRSRRQSADAQMSARKPAHSLNSSKYKRVEHWLQNQSQSKQITLMPESNTDGEASCEYTTESEARDSDGSEGLADSVATTCLQATGNKSQFTSTEVITSSVDLLKECPDSSCSSNKVVPRTNRRNSERPVSVSCISQLTKQNPTNCSSDDANNQLARPNHSISESALHMLNISSQSSLPIRGSDSKSSLKKRRMRMKKKQRSESGSNASDASGGNRRGSYNSLMKSESFSSSVVIKETQIVTVESTVVDADNDDEITLPKPNFQLGACTTNMFNASHLGNLAPLAFYNRDRNVNNRELSFTGTEDNSIPSDQIDQVWDDYQEKYLSEAYSEGRDSDAARKLLEFGDDYRNFIDSQSDCCSSLSAANNLDSMSPPRGRKPLPNAQIINKSTSKSPSDDDIAMRRRRAFEIEWRRRTHAENHRKPLTEERRKLSSGADTVLSRTSHKSQKTPKSNISRKLEMEFNKAFFGGERRRIKSNDQKEITSSSSAASSDAENDSHIDIVLNQTRRDLENTQALKIRRHLLHSEDYTEIIATCSENMRCLKTVLHSPGGSMLSNRRHELIRELLSSWESLLHWSENESFVKQSQEEMAALVDKLNKIGTSEPNLDTESAIQFAIQETKDEKAQLHTYRSSMLRLNASVHSWLTRHEKRKQIETAMNKTATEPGHNDENAHSAEESALESSTITLKEASISSGVGTSTDAYDCTFNEDLHKQLKNEVGNMYKVWDEADERVKNRLESLTTSLIAWKQFENGLNEFKEVLGKDTGALKRLTGALEMGSDVVSNNLAHDVKEVAKRLSEKMDNNNTMVTATGQQTSNSQPRLSHIGSMPFNLPSNGSLSDSGISDGGCSSDYGLSERERRLGALRRLAKQLEQALVPGSEALNSINNRMEMAEAELRSLQETCRELIIRTAVSQPNHLATSSQESATIPQNAIASSSSATNIINQQPINFQIPIINVKAKTTKRTTPNKRKQRRRTNSNGANGISLVTAPKLALATMTCETTTTTTTASEPDPDDPKDHTIVEDADEKRTWSWRVAKYAVPVQLALIALFCAACFIEPHCCDGVNNFSWSLTPHLRYVRGPPPV